MASSTGGEAMLGVAVVMVPFPAQGHLNQLLHLSRLVAGCGVAVHFVGSATHNRQARVRLGGWDVGAFPNIRFHDLPVPPFASPRPDPHAPMKFPPSHLQPAFDACLHMQAPLASLLRSLSASSRRIVVVHDSLMSFAAQEVDALPNGEAYVFHTVSAFANLLFQWAACGKHGQLRSMLPDAPIAPVEGCFTEEFMDFIKRQYQKTPPPAGRLFNTCREVEGKFVDLLAQEPSLQKGRYFTVGPLNPVVALGPGGAGDSPPRQHECMEWLDRQPPGSVVYVSFGTTLSMPDRQIAELAAGLERSRQRFIWVLRDADRGDIFAAEQGDTTDGGQQLPLGYEQRVAGRGMVVRGWAPQLDILGHRAAGLFMTHCGWNSCMEGLSNGVPMAAWPLHSDQPKNALLVTEVLKVGVTVRDWACRDETVSSSAVEAAIRRVMDSQEGRAITRRAKALANTIRRAMSEGGSSREELRSFISYITR